MFQQAFQVILVSQNNLCFIFQGAAQALPQPPPALGHHLLQLLLIFYLHPVLLQRFIWPPTLSTWAADIPGMISSSLMVLTAIYIC